MSSKHPCKTLLILSLFLLASLPEKTRAEFKPNSLTSNQSLAYGAGFDLCFNAKEKLPQIPAIRRTPNTVADMGSVTDVKFQNEELWIFWEIKNLYSDNSFRVVLNGICVLTSDGKKLKNLLVKDKS